MNVLVAEAQVAEKAEKPDFPDIDNDKNTTEPISKVAKDKAEQEKGGGDKPQKLTAKQKKLPKGLQKAIANNESTIKEGKGMPSKTHVMKMIKDGKKEADMLKMHPDADKEKLKALIKSCKKEMKEALEGYINLIEGKEDEAELVMAAKDMVTRVTSWMEDTAEMQTESMLELADAIRDEMGQAESDSFVGVVKPALESMYTAMESTREALTQGVGMLTGEGGAPAEDMGEEPAPDAPADDAEMEPTVDQDEADAAADEFAAPMPQLVAKKKSAEKSVNQKPIKTK